MKGRLWFTALTWVLLIAIAGLQTGCNLLSGPDTPTETPTPLLETPTQDPEVTPTNTPEPDTGPPAVTVSPLQAEAGQTVDVTATGFPPSTGVVIGFGRVDSEYDVIATTQTDANGVVQTQVTVPAFAEPEDDFVFVVATEDNEEQVVSEVFNVTAMETEVTIAVAPESGAPGSTVDILAQGFPVNAAVEIGFGRVDSEYDVVKTTQVNDEGMLDTQATVPEFATAADEWVWVVATTDHEIQAVSDIFDVEQLGGGAPTLTVSPQAGAPGDQVQLQAQGFQPNIVLEMGFGRVNSEYDVLTTARTDKMGAVTIRLTVPDFAEPEDAWVWIAAAEEMPTQSASTRFDVVASGPTPTATPSDGLFTRTNIYLIAIGDAGQTGKEIGCDDSVVPVEVEIEPTIAPLRAALEQLLAIDTETYGQSGLYSALYASDLTVGSIDIVQGKATIALSGDLVLAGVCDNPRVAAQLEETALQFSTVNQVEILLNGEPLDQVLSQQ